MNLTKRLLLVFIPPLALLAILTGCIIVPQTKISGSLNGQPWGLACPKNVELTGLEIVASTNSISAKIQSLKTVMDPAVISTTAEGQALLLKTGIDAGAAAAGKAMGAAAK